MWWCTKIDKYEVCSVSRSSLNHGGGVDVSLMRVSTQLVEEVQVHRKTRRTSFVSVIIAFVTGIITFVISFITYPYVSVTPIVNITTQNQPCYRRYHFQHCDQQHYFVNYLTVSLPHSETACGLGKLTCFFL